MASTRATTAALNAGWHVRTDCSVMAPGEKTGVASRSPMPSPVQSTYSASGSVSMVPPSSTTRPGSIDWTWPIRTTCSMCRSFSSSPCDRIAHRYIVGSTVWSMRIRQPSASSCR